MKQLLASLVDSSKLAGYVRAGVASGLGLLLAHVPGLSEYLSPDTQTALGVFLSGVIVGVWSHYVKNGEKK